MNTKTFYTGMPLAALGLTLVFAGWAFAGRSLSPELSKKVIQTVDADAKLLTKIFKDIHQNAELSFMETQGSKEATCCT